MGDDDKFEWEDSKNDYNLKKHGLPLYFGRFVFADPYHFTIAAKDGINSDEKRFMAVGLVSNRIMCVVYTKRKHKIRLISLMRRSGRLQNEYWKKRRANDN